jgi:hypothetical protein
MYGTTVYMLDEREWEVYRGSKFVSLAGAVEWARETAKSQWERGRECHIAVWDVLTREYITEVFCGRLVSQA